MLAVFAELVRADGNGPVADLGCGPGRGPKPARTRHESSGVDLSPGDGRGGARGAPAPAGRRRVDVGDRPTRRRARRHRRVVLDHPHAAGAAAVGVRRVPPGARARGRLLLAFQAGDACVHLEHAYGHAISTRRVPVVARVHTPRGASNTGSSCRPNSSASPWNARRPSRHTSWPARQTDPPWPLLEFRTRRPMTVRTSRIRSWATGRWICSSFPGGGITSRASGMTR